MAACDRTYPRVVCKQNNWYNRYVICSSANPTAKGYDYKVTQYVDEITNTVCSEKYHSNCSCIVS